MYLPPISVSSGCSRRGNGHRKDTPGLLIPLELELSSDVAVTPHRCLSLEQQQHRTTPQSDAADLPRSAGGGEQSGADSYPMSVIASSAHRS